MKIERKYMAHTVTLLPAKTVSSVAKATGAVHWKNISAAIVADAHLIKE